MSHLPGDPPSQKHPGAPPEHRGCVGMWARRPDSPVASCCCFHCSPAAAGAHARAAPPGSAPLCGRPGTVCVFEGDWGPPFREGTESETENGDEQRGDLQPALPAGARPWARAEEPGRMETWPGGHLRRSQGRPEGHGPHAGPHGGWVPRQRGPHGLSPRHLAQGKGEPRGRRKTRGGRSPALFPAGPHLDSARCWGPRPPRLVPLPPCKCASSLEKNTFWVRGKCHRARGPGRVLKEKSRAEFSDFSETSRKFQTCHLYFLSNTS